VLIIADARCEPIIGKLAKAGLDVTVLQDTGQLECISAESLLKSWMAGGTLDETLLKDTANSIVTQAKTHSASGKVRVFGEMVSLLLAQNDVLTAERLEEIWNQIIQIHSISVVCSYKLIGSGFNTLPESLALMHTHTLPE
jgi:hypothetical protein